MNRKIIIQPISSAAEGPLYQQIVDGLKREISEGRLKANEPLPSFRELAKDLLVSIITVKRAYEELEREGIIYRKQGLGTFVSENGNVRSQETKLKYAEKLISEAVREAGESGLSKKDIYRLIKKIVEKDELKIQNSK